MPLLKKKPDDRAWIPALGGVQLGSCSTDVSKLVADRHRAVPVVHNNLRFRDSRRTSRLRRCRRCSGQPVFELTVHVSASGDAHSLLRRAPEPGPAAEPVSPDPEALLENQQSGDFFSAPLDQKNNSDDKQNAGDDSYQGCVIHIYPSIAYIGT
jgi:hypothetical protein